MWAKWKHHLTAALILAGTGLWSILAPPWAEGEKSLGLLPVLLTSRAPGTLGTRFFGYGALVLLGLALSIGPLARLRPRTFARWIPYRRAIGIWSAFAGVAHLLYVIKLVSHEFYRLTWLTLFLTPWHQFGPDGSPKIAYQLRIETVSIVAWLGLIALLLLLLVALVSNDPLQRFLGTATWKLVQQWSYTAFIFAALHLLVMRFGGKLKLSLPLAKWSLWAALLVAILQAAGFIHTIWKRRKQRRGKDAAA